MEERRQELKRRAEEKAHDKAMRSVKPRPKNVQPKEWKMEAVKGSRRREKDDKTFYLIKWVDWPKLTWEPEENLDGCQDLIDAYLEEEEKKEAEKVEWQKWLWSRQSQQKRVRFQEPDKGGEDDDDDEEEENQDDGESNQEDSMAAAAATPSSSLPRKTRNGGYECPECAKAFKSKQYLKWHIDGQHRGVKYDCGHCGKLYSHATSLKRHVKKKHGNAAAAGEDTAAAAGDETEEEELAEGAAIKVHVKTPKDKKTIDTREKTEVKDFKVTISSAFGAPVEQLCLIYAGKILKDHETLDTHGINDDKMVHLVIKTGQGANRPAGAAGTESSAPSQPRTNPSQLNYVEPKSSKIPGPAMTAAQRQAQFRYQRT